MGRDMLQVLIPRPGMFISGAFLGLLEADRPLGGSDQIEVNLSVLLVCYPELFAPRTTHTVIVRKL